MVITLSYLWIIPYLMLGKGQFSTIHAMPFDEHKCAVHSAHHTTTDVHIE